MLIRQVKISNFRSILYAEIELGENTVFIGPNNAGKSAILEAIRISLTRRWGQRGTGFTEYDVHLCEARPDPKVGDPVVIELELQEGDVGEWPDELQAELVDIIQTDPISGKASIILRVSCQWDVAEESYVPEWQFLRVDRKPLVGAGARAVNFQEFFRYLPVFYLEALRDAGSEFSVRSKFWGKLLQTVNIPDELEERSKGIFDELNTEILDADDLLKDLATGLSGIGRVAVSDIPGEANLRVLPLNTWDLLSKAEVIYQTEGGKPWLPLLRHGQGIQSLSVIFLFKAFIELLLADLYRPESSAVLAMEEPETHLHPQAARSLQRHIKDLPGQKIVTTHSPYYLQHVPFRDIRVVRQENDGTSVRSLPREFRAVLPHDPSVDLIIDRSRGLVSFDRGLGELVIHGTLSEQLFRDLLVAYNGVEEAHNFQTILRGLYENSKTFIPDSELEQLETFARRIRGEIFFAQRWLLVEGQSDYQLVHGIADGLGYNLDEHGVAVIDFQNNGNPESFAVLARALGYPWMVVVDGDDAGNKYLDQIQGRGFSAEEMTLRSRKLPNGYLEQQLVADGLQGELKSILKELGVAGAEELDDENLIETLKDGKTGYASVLARRCVMNKDLAKIMPEPFRNALEALKGLQ